MDNPIATYRKAAGLSQQQFADAIGVGRVSVARWEIGTRRIDPKYLCAISQLTGIDPRDLRPDLAIIFGA